MDAAKAQRAIQLLVEGSTRELRAIALRGCALMEERRGGQYGIESRVKHERRIQKEAVQRFRRYLAEILPQSAFDWTPPAPPDELAQYRCAVSNHEYAVVTGKTDWDPPPIPSSVDRFHSQERASVEHLWVQLKPFVDWRSEEYQRKEAEAIVERIPIRRLQIRTGRKQNRKLRETPVRSAIDLAGSTPFESIELRQLREAAQSVVRCRLNLELTFAVDIRGKAESLAEIARNAESDQHHNAVAQTVGVLRRLGFNVYPRDVGIEGYHSMADMVAWDNKEVWFVECLTKASIRHGSHERKLLLARHVPYCFVGELPDDFTSTLPRNVHVIRSPHSAFTSRDEPTPFYLTSSPPSLVVRVSRKRILNHLSFEIPQVRLPEDTAGLLCHYLWRGWRQRGKSDLKPIPPRHAVQRSAL